MKFFKLMMIALMAMIGLSSCSESSSSDSTCNHDLTCDHNFIEVDYSKDIVGTWTCMEDDYAEAFVFKADGSLVTTGFADDNYWEDIEANWTLVNNKLCLNYKRNKEEFLLEIVPGKTLCIVNLETGDRNIFDYCANDLADEIVGMWVDNGANENEIVIQTYQEDGKVIRTGYVPGIDALAANYQATYKVIGDLLFVNSPSEILGEKEFSYAAVRLTYLPNGTSLGDIMTYKKNIPFGDDFKEEEMTFLRIKQSLNLTGKTYDYSSAYVSNAKGTDEDFTIMGHTFNMDKIKAGDFDVMFRSELFNVELNSNSFNYKLLLDNGQDAGFDVPMTVEGNKVSIDMSTINSVLRKVDMYMFQDADDTQLHIYMHTDAFINYFANMELYTLILEGKLDPTDAAAVEKVFTDMEARVESINVSFVMKAREQIMTQVKIIGEIGI